MCVQCVRLSLHDVLPSTSPRYWVFPRETCFEAISSFYARLDCFCPTDGCRREEAEERLSLSEAQVAALQTELRVAKEVSSPVRRPFFVEHVTKSMTMAVAGLGITG